MRFFVTLLGLICVAALGWQPQPAAAKPARCSTTDDGSFPCQFRATDRNGSFQISARGKPTFILNMTQAGVAAGYVNFGGRNTPLPGRYLRDASEPGCWINDVTQTRICAY